MCYFIFLFLLGIPLYTHDLKVGQYFRKGAFGKVFFLSLSLSLTRTDRANAKKNGVNKAPKRTCPSFFLRN